MHGKSSGKVGVPTHKANFQRITSCWLSGSRDNAAGFVLSPYTDILQAATEVHTACKGQGVPIISSQRKGHCPSHSRSWVSALTLSPFGARNRSQKLGVPIVRERHFASGRNLSHPQTLFPFYPALLSRLKRIMSTSGIPSCESCIR